MQPLDVLADELGAVAGRVERELRQGFAALEAKFDARLAQIELQALQAEHARQDEFRKLCETVTNRLAEIKDGQPGPPGKDGDMEAVFAKFDEFAHEQNKSLDLLEGCLKSVVEGKLAEVDAKLAEVKDGAEGPPGPEGKAGKLPIVKEWSPGVHYEGDVVTHNGATYQALLDTGGAPPSGDWRLLAGRGLDGKGFSHRGTYDPQKSYKSGDVVAKDGHAFVAVEDQTGGLPGDGWKILVSRGERGRPGPQGEAGAKGEKGERGASIIAGSIDPTIKVMDLVDSDGEKITLDLEPFVEVVRNG
jgi:hypothetical protein